MSVIYFTNTMDSGDGSFRQALGSASSEDVVSPDPDVFARNAVVSIPLSSRLNVSDARSITIDGAGRRLRLDGQGAAQVMLVRSTRDGTLRFVDVDFVRGRLSAFGACFQVETGAGGSIVCERCLFAGSNRPTTGGSPLANLSPDCEVVVRDSILDKSVQNSFVYCAAGCSATFVGCDLIGAVPSGTNIETLDCIQTTSPETVGFVSYPSGERSIDDWLDFDLRLTFDSPYISGATISGVDFEGRERLDDGCVGALANVRLLRDAETFDVDSRATAYILEGSVAIGTLDCSGALVFPSAADGAVLSVVDSATLDGAIVTGTGYLALPAETNVDGATIGDDVRLCVYDGALASFTATAVEAKRIELRWSAREGYRPLIERLDDDVWTLVADSSLASSVGSTESVAATRSGRAIFRAFDGANWFSDAAWTSFGSQYKVVSTWTSATVAQQNWKAVFQMATTEEVVRVGQSATILARISDAFDDSATLENDGTNVVSVKYSCYRLSNGLFESAVESVPGHVDVEVDPDCVLEALQTSSAWTLDSLGYNFVLTPDVRTAPLFPSRGEYRVKATIELADGNPIVFSVPVTVEE